MQVSPSRHQLASNSFTPTSPGSFLRISTLRRQASRKKQKACFEGYEDDEAGMTYDVTKTKDEALAGGSEQAQRRLFVSADTVSEAECRAPSGGKYLTF
ncbi:hypothetical protein ACOMHN_049809 [Nucella lapillus]